MAEMLMGTWTDPQGKKHKVEIAVDEQGRMKTTGTSGGDMSIEEVKTGLEELSGESRLSVSAVKGAAEINTTSPTIIIPGGDIQALGGYVPKGKTSAHVIDALNKATALNQRGLVMLDADLYDASSDLIPLKSGVVLEGRQATQKITTDVPEISWTLENGTVLQGAGVPILTHNHIDRASAIAQFSSDALSSAHVRRIGFLGAGTGLKVGARNAMGALNCVFEDIYYLDADIGVQFKNFLYCSFRRIYGRQRLGTELIGQYYGADVPLAKLIPGNSVFEHIFNWTGFRNTRGIVFEQTAGSQLNELNSIRIQQNRNGEAVAGSTATFTSGSTSISVANPALYSVGMPVTLAASVGGIWSGQAYFVASKAGSNITLANRPGGAAVTPNANGSTTLSTGGYPGLEIIAAPGEYMTNARFWGLDLETVGAIPLVACGISNMILDLQERIAGPALDVVLRGADSASKLICLKSNVKTDFDNEAGGVRVELGTGSTAAQQTGSGQRNNKYKSGPSPTVTKGAALGTNGTANITWASADGGCITLTTVAGDTPVAGVLATVNLTAQALYDVYGATISPANSAANALSGAAKVRIQESSRNNGFDFVCDQALPAVAATYRFNFKS